MIFQSKDKRQEDGAVRWRDSGGKGTLVYPPGFGKTRTALIIVDKMSQTNSNLDLLVAVIVPSDIAKKTWLKQIADYKKSLPIYVYTKEEVIKLDTPINISLLIVDEIHKFTTDRDKSVYNGSKVIYKYGLALTGTFPDGNLAQYISRYFPVVDEIDEEEAIDNRWISPFIEFNIALELPHEDKIRYEKLSEPIGETLSLFKDSHLKFVFPNGDKLFRDDYDLIVSCYSGKRYKGDYIKASIIRDSLAMKMGWSKDIPLINQYNVNRDKYWNPIAIEQRCSDFMKLVYNRNKIINNNRVKLDMVIDLYKTFPNPTICFSKSTEFADLVAGKINALIDMFDVDIKRAVCYHSNIESRHLVGEDGKVLTYGKGAKKEGEPKIFGKESLKKNAIEGMNNGIFGFLSTAEALNEALDIPQLSQVITTGGSANPLTYKQRNARAQRIDIYNPEKLTIIFNLFFDDFTSVTNALDKNGNIKLIVSRDKAKLISRQRKNNYTTYNVNTIDQIKKILPI